MYIDGYILVPNFGMDDEAGAIAKPVNELNVTVLSEFAPLSGVSDALQKPRRILGGDRRPFDRVVLAINHDNRRLADLQPQAVRAI